MTTSRAAEIPGHTLGAATAAGPSTQAGIDSRADAATRAHRALARRKRLMLLALLILTVTMLLADIAVGGAGMGAGTLLRPLFTPGSAPTIDTRIVWEIRLPMSLTGLLVGAALAVAGAQMQTILDNPLAEPYTLGISAAWSRTASATLPSK